MSLTLVTRDQFYSYVNPRDIVVSSLRNNQTKRYESQFKTRSGQLVGVVASKNSYNNDSDYFLEKHLINS